VLRTCGILLAAGSGTRFGGGKLIHPLPGSGVPMAVAAWRTLRAAIPDSCVVVRAGDSAALSVFRAEGARIVECDDAGEGMGRSLACGVRANSYAGGWVIALGDMPSLRPATIAAIAQALEAHSRIVVPTCNGSRGHPVGFPAGFHDALVALHGDAGARLVLKAHADQVDELALDDAGTLADVDTPADLGKLPAADTPEGQRLEK